MPNTIVSNESFFRDKVSNYSSDAQLQFGERNHNNQSSFSMRCSFLIHSFLESTALLPTDKDTAGHPHLLTSLGVHSFQ